MLSIWLLRLLDILLGLLDFEMLKACLSFNLLALEEIWRQVVEYPKSVIKFYKRLSSFILRVKVLLKELVPWIISRKQVHHPLGRRLCTSIFYSKVNLILSLYFSDSQQYLIQGWGFVTSSKSDIYPHGTMILPQQYLCQPSHGNK